MKQLGASALFVLSMGLPAMSSSQRMTVIQTASTNSPEIRITVPQSSSSKEAAAVTAEAAGSKQEVPYGSREQKRLWTALEAAGSLASLPVSHCMKSASFGTRLFVELDGQRSPDLSCPHQSDAKVAALRIELEKLLSATASHVERLK